MREKSHMYVWFECNFIRFAGATFSSARPAGFSPAHRADPFRAATAAGTYRWGCVCVCVCVNV